MKWNMIDFTTPNRSFIFKNMRQIQVRVVKLGFL